MADNLPPIPDGYELVPDEETKERRKSDVGCKVLRLFLNEWMDPKAIAGRFKYHPSQRYIRPIKATNNTKELTVSDNLPPIPDGYELVPKEEYGILLTTTDMLYCNLHQIEQPRWVAVQTIDRPTMGTAFFDVIKYIRPIKPAATPTSTKPPLGLRSRIVWLEARKQEIREAMERCVEERKNVPYTWVEELLALETQIKNWKGE